MSRPLSCRPSRPISKHDLRHFLRSIFRKYLNSFCRISNPLLFSVISTSNHVSNDLPLIFCWKALAEIRSWAIVRDVCYITWICDWSLEVALEFAGKALCFLFRRRVVACYRVAHATKTILIMVTKYVQFDLLIPARCVGPARVPSRCAQ